MLERGNELENGPVVLSSVSKLLDQILDQMAEDRSVPKDDQNLVMGLGLAIEHISRHLSVDLRRGRGGRS
jgi:hypothetical protein